MRQIFNPFLPLDAYIADGEPHVFGDRVYLFGSHDREGGESFCMENYEFFSAPIHDLTDWSSKGINYSAAQDPLHGENAKYLYAPDVVQGNDGRFYLYYCLAGWKGRADMRILSVWLSVTRRTGSINTMESSVIRMARRTWILSVLIRL